MTARKNLSLSKKEDLIFPLVQMHQNEYPNTTQLCNFIVSHLKQRGFLLGQRAVRNVVNSYIEKNTDRQFQYQEPSGFGSPNMTVDLDNLADRQELFLSPYIQEDHMPELRKMWAWFEGTFSILWTQIGRKNRLAKVGMTYRNARWYAYLADYAPSITDPVDKFSICTLLSQREHIANLTNREIDNVDLLKWLDYRPWLGGAWAERYQKMISNGGIPIVGENDPRRIVSHIDTLEGFKIVFGNLTLPSRSSVTAFTTDLMHSIGADLFFGNYAKSAGDVNTGEIWELPSRKIALWTNNRSSFKYVLVVTDKGEQMRQDTMLQVDIYRDI